MEYEESTNERENVSQYPPSVYYDESGNEEELPIQSISSTRSLKKLIKPTHDVVKKKKRRKKRGKEFCVIEVFKFWVRYRYEENKEWQDPNIGDAQGTPR